MVETTRRALWDKGLGRAFYYLGALDASRLHNERALVALHRAVPRTSARAAAGALTGIARLRSATGCFRAATWGDGPATSACSKGGGLLRDNLGQASSFEGEPPVKLLYLTVHRA